MRKGLTALVTAGPTRERLDPVRYITNDSSGKQGYAIAEALEKSGVSVTLITGITHHPHPPCSYIIITESARDMHAACMAALPVDIAICAAAVADFRPETISAEKIKKHPDIETFQLSLIKNPDILYDISTHHAHRPELVVGFAAETENVLENAQQKLKKKRCDWILANDVTDNIFNSDENAVEFITASTTQHWDRTGKINIAQLLVKEIQQHFLGHHSS